MRVLIVDDEKALRDIMNILFKDAGFEQTIQATNGKEALDLLKSESADLIISDWSMPEMDGLELLKACKKDPLIKNIPFVISSARCERSEMQEAIEAGADAYVVKPFRFRELDDTLQKVRLKADRTSALLTV